MRSSVSSAFGERELLQQHLFSVSQPYSGNMTSIFNPCSDWDRLDPEKPLVRFDKKTRKWYVGLIPGFDGFCCAICGKSFTLSSIVKHLGRKPPEPHEGLSAADELKDKKNRVCPYFSPCYRFMMMKRQGTGTQSMLDSLKPNGWQLDTDDGWLRGEAEATDANRPGNGADDEADDGVDDGGDDNPPRVAGGDENFGGNMANQGGFTNGNIRAADNGGNSIAIEANADGGNRAQVPMLDPSDEPVPFPGIGRDMSYGSLAEAAALSDGERASPKSPPSVGDFSAAALEGAKRLSMLCATGESAPERQQQLEPRGSINRDSGASDLQLFPSKSQFEKMASSLAPGASNRLPDEPPAREPRRDTSESRYHGRNSCTCEVPSDQPERDSQPRRDDISGVRRDLGGNRCHGRGSCMCQISSDQVEGGSQPRREHEVQPQQRAQQRSISGARRVDHFHGDRIDRGMFDIGDRAADTATVERSYRLGDITLSGDREADVVRVENNLDIDARDTAEKMIAATYVDAHGKVRFQELRGRDKEIYEEFMARYVHLEEARVKLSHNCRYNVFFKRKEYVEDDLIGAATGGNKGGMDGEFDPFSNWRISQVIPNLSLSTQELPPLATLGPY